LKGNGGGDVVLVGEGRKRSGGEAFVRNEEAPVDGGRRRWCKVTQGKEVKGNVTFLTRRKGNGT
jgi:hypothetical protein